MIGAPSFSWRRFHFFLGEFPLKNPLIGEKPGEFGGNSRNISERGIAAFPSVKVGMGKRKIPGFSKDF